METGFENSESASPCRASDPFHGRQLLGEDIFCNNLGVRSHTDQVLALGTMLGEAEASDGHWLLLAAAEAGRRE